MFLQYFILHFSFFFAGKQRFVCSFLFQLYHETNQDIKSKEELGWQFSENLLMIRLCVLCKSMRSGKEMDFQLDKLNFILVYLRSPALISLNFWYF